MVEKKFLEQVFGYVERLTFQNIENGFTVAHLIQPQKTESICIKGILPGLQPGETIRCSGHWKNHLVHGRQFEVTHFQIEAPADAIGIKKYLSSGLIKGIGPKYAERIVDRFGTDTFSILENSPEKLFEIDGLGSKRIEKIKTCWQNQKGIRNLMVFLQSYGVSPAFAQKIYKKYGDNSIAVVKENPYTLSRYIFGIGFKSADLLAQKMGIAHDAVQRLDSGMEYVLAELSNNGHVCYPKEELILETAKILEVPEAPLEERIMALHQEQRIEVKELIQEGKRKTYVWLKSLYIAEMGIARELRRLKKGVCSLRSVNTDRAIQWVQEKLQIQLAENQRAAVSSAISDKIHIITGGPGTGKSTITKAILAISSQLTEKIFLAAPTGRAAKRMSEITGYKASTIHSLLEFNFKGEGFKRNKENPLDCDLIIIDEASMIDTFLMNSLLKALPDHARVIFVGDVNQLPSVGPGNVLKDIMQSLSFSMTTLKEIFRQAAGSYIITNAHKINQGIFPQLYCGANSDFFFIECQDPQEVLNQIIKLVAQRLPQHYGFNPTEDIQVLAPMKKGVIGTENLNQSLQQILNPKENALFRSGCKFQVDDKVMQIRNNYKREVYNGDIGYIQTIDSEEQQISVRFDEKIVIYDYTSLDELVLAYAISIHKFQGSEFPCIVMPIHTAHFMLLHRNLLYTGITRGKKLIVLVGSKKAVAIAVQNDDVKKRHTSLKQSLMELI